MGTRALPRCQEPSNERADMTAGAIRTAQNTTGNLSVDCDFCVVGSGAGGSMAAATLAATGARVVLLEEGGYHTRREFNMEEAWAYPTLYQDHGNRATEDLGIMILQGRSVGGGTTVNWASSFRPPENTLRRWADDFAVSGLDAAALAPHLEAVERRLNVQPGTPDGVNRNNQILWDGASKLGWKPELIRRSVKNCAKLGYCGMGCPLDAKQSALVTYVQDALASGADLYSNCRVTGIGLDRGRVREIAAEILDEALDRPTGRILTVRPARGLVLAAGAINTAALLLRSGVGNDSGLVGRRTFLHPAVPMVGMFAEPVEGFYGAPQSVSCHHFADRADDVGYFLEVSPVHPMLASIAFPGFGDPHRRIAERLAFAQATIALLIDGHHDDQGGRASCTPDGRIKLSYPIGNALREAAVDACKTMARMLLAAGATEVISLHTDPLFIHNESEIARLDDAPFGPNLHTMFSAHQMGGCPMGDDPERSVVSSRGQHHQIKNLWITDGSVFPTALGVNPQLSIYALSRLFASEIARPG